MSSASLGKISTFLLAAASLVVCPGCNPYGPKAKKQSATPTTASPARGKEPIQSEVIEAVLRTLAQSGSQSDLGAALLQLNELLAPHNDEAPPLSPALRRLIAEKGWFPFDQLDGPQFTPSDVDYLRDMTSLGLLARTLRKPGDDDLSVARRSFAWVVRHIQLSAPGRAQEASPWLVCLRGYGTPSERTWVFLELLRQLNVEGAVVGGLDQAGAAPGALSAVLVKEGSDWSPRLFNAATGLPVFQDGAPATLKAVVASPALLGEGEKKPREAALLLPVQEEALTGRMALLQSVLVGEAQLVLHFDLGAWYEHATAALREVPHSAGVSVWKKPAEVRTALAAPAGRAAVFESRNIFYWGTERESPYMLLLQGRPAEAARKFIEYDSTKPAAQIAAELNASSAARLTPAAINRSVVQTRQDVIFFGGLALLERPKSQPDVARRWFERYLKQFGAPGFTPENLLDVGKLCARLNEDARKSTPSPSRRIWAMLDASQRSLVEAAAQTEGNRSHWTDALREDLIAQIQELNRIVDDFATETGPDSRAKTARLQTVQKRLDEIAGQVPPAAGAAIIKSFLDEIAKQINELGANQVVREKQQRLSALRHRLVEREGETAQLEAGVREKLVQVFNSVLPERDFATQADFQAVVATAFPEIKAIFAADRAKLAASDVVKLNRQLLYGAFGDAVLSNPEFNSLWAPGARRNLALCLHREGRNAEAAAFLKADPSPLQDVQRLEAAAWARLFETAPATNLD